MADYDRESANAALRKLGYSTPDDNMSDGSAMGGAAPAPVTSAVPPTSQDALEDYEKPVAPTPMEEDPNAAPLGSVASAQSAEPVPPPAAPAAPAPKPVTEAGPPEAPGVSVQPPEETLSSEPIMSEAPAVSKAPEFQESAPAPDQSTPDQPTPAASAPPAAAPAAPGAVTVTVGQPAAAPAAPAPSSALQAARTTTPPTGEPEYNGGARTADLKANIEKAKQAAIGVADSNIGIQQTQAEETRAGGQKLQDAQGVANARQAQSAEDNKARYEESRKAIQTELDDMKFKMGHPPTDTVGIVMGLVAAMAASQGKGTLAAAFQAVGDKMNTRMRRYQGEIEGHQKAAEGLGKVVNMDRLAGMDDDQRQSAIDKGITAELLTGLDVVEKTAKDKTEINNAKLVRTKLVDELNQREVARRKAAAVVAARARAQRDIASQTTLEGAAAAAARHGEVGDKLFKGRMTNVMNPILAAQKSAGEVAAQPVEMETKRAAARLSNAKAAVDEAKAGAGGVEGAIHASPIRGWLPPAGMPAAALKPIMDEQRDFAKIAFNLDRLGQIAAKVKASGGWDKVDPDTRAEVDAIRTVLTPQQTQVWGAGSPTSHEYETFNKISANPVAFIMMGDAQKQIARSLSNINGANAQALRSNNFVSADEARAMAAEGKGTPSPMTGGYVEMTNPQTGAVERMQPSLVEAAKAAGYTPADEAE